MKKLIATLIYFFNIKQTIKYLNGNNYMSSYWTTNYYSDKSKDWDR